MYRQLFLRRFYLLALAGVILILVWKTLLVDLFIATALSIEIKNNYRIHSNITYAIASKQELKLDLYERKTNKPNPTVIFIHGGGWSQGSKEEVQQDLLPYLKLGFSAINIEYRLAQVAKAPAALEDCMCALSWIVKNSHQYHLDSNKIVAVGQSAGGHLALLASMISPDIKLALPCQQDSQFKIAAIINWFGISDLKGLLEDSKSHEIAGFWLGNRHDRDLLATQLSPINYVRPGIPPILSIHGDRDEIVPYIQSLRLHQALDRAEIPNRLITILDGQHGNFKPAQVRKIERAIEQFLNKNWQ
jgi:acetyl esterase/lipase